jgi:hypothetical protein
MAARRPLLDELLRDAHDLRDTVFVDWRPCDAEARRQLGAECRLVQHPCGLLRLEQLAPVEREPLGVRRADLVRDEVGVQLWVGGSRGAMDEARGDEPIGVDLQDTVVSTTGERRVLVDESERCGDRCLVRGQNLIGSLLLRERPQPRDTFWWLCRIADYAEYER